jgi:drug/metabolite transporter (DMT)-like permease
VDDFTFGVILGILSSMFFAIQNVIVKWLGEDVRPVAANSIRLWVSLPIVFIIALNPFRQANLIMPLETILILGLSVVFAAGFGDVIYFLSQDRIGVSTAFAIANTYPIVTYFLAILFLGELFIPARFLGVVLAIAGIVFISREQRDSRSEEESKLDSVDKIGYLLAGVTCVSFALATVLVDVGVTGVDPLDANVIRLTLGSVMIAPAFYWSKSRGMPIPSRRGIKIMAIAGFFGMALASTFWVASVKYVGATLSAIIGSVAPLIALPFSVKLLNENVNWKVGIGTIATILGIWITLIAG